MALRTLFRRVCSLLMVGIKPVFVFDGKPPALKYEVLKRRKARRNEAADTKEKAKDTLRSNVLKMMALQQFGDEISDRDVDQVLDKLKDNENDELFQHQEIDPSKLVISESESEIETESEDEAKEVERVQKTVEANFISSLVDTENIDLNDEDFSKLTYSDQLGVLNDMKDLYRFGRSQLRPFDPNESKKVDLSEKFVDYQVEGILARGRIRDQIKQVENCRKMDRMGDLMETQSLKAVKKSYLGKKTALFELKPDQPVKKMKTIFDERKTEEEKVPDMEKVLSMPAFSRKTDKRKKKVTLVEHFKNYQPESKNQQNVKIVGLDIQEPVRNIRKTPVKTHVEDEIMSSSDDDSDQGPANSELKIEVTDSADDLAAKLRKQLYSNLHNKIVAGKLPQGKSHPTDDEIMTSSDDETLSPKDKRETELDTPKQELSNLPSTSSSFIQTIETSTGKDVKKDTPTLDDDIMTSSSDEDDSNPPIKTTDKIPTESSLEAPENDNLPSINTATDSSTPQVEKTAPDANQAAEGEILTTLEGEADVKDEKVEEPPKSPDSRPPTPIMDSSDDEEVPTSELLETSTEKVDSYNEKGEVSDDKSVAVDESVGNKDESTTEAGSNVDQEAKSEEVETKEESDTESEVKQESAVEIESWDAIKRQNELSRVTIENAERISSAPSQELYADAAKLLTLFGCALIFAPGEAEAQCAQLELDKVTNGTITDDSDAFLFGSRKVYRKMDLGTMTPLLYDIESIKLSRDEMIALAQLTGSDYCPGVVGIGPKTAYKILTEFSPLNNNNFFRSLEAFSSWWKLHHQTLTSGADGSKFRLKLKKLNLDADFPNSNASNAYYNPDITPNVTSLRKLGARDFPDLEGLRQFALEKMFWSSEQFDEHMKPVLKSRIEPKKSNIHFYFAKK